MQLQVMPEGCSHWVRGVAGLSWRTFAQEHKYMCDWPTVCCRWCPLAVILEADTCIQSNQTGQGDTKSPTVSTLRCCRERARDFCRQAGCMQCIPLAKSLLLTSLRESSCRQREHESGRGCMTGELWMADVFLVKTGWWTLHRLGLTSTLSQCYDAAHGATLAVVGADVTATGYCMSNGYG